MDAQTIGIISALAGLVGTIIGIFKAHGAWRKWKAGWKKRIANFFDDWEGRPGRPGVDREPGVMERLQTLEATQASQGETLATQDRSLATITKEVNKAVQQVQNSHLTNLRDDVDEVIGKVDDLHDKLDAHLKPGPTTTINVHAQESP
jgi:uncharacterized coiled-coil protein SlyX